LYLDLIRWDRPAGWLLLLWPTLSALWVASEGVPRWSLIIVFILGTILMRSAGCCINDIFDRDFDKHVKRTAFRPVTTGKIRVKEALFLGITLSLLAFSLVFFYTNLLTVTLSFVALSLTILYPLAKRFVSIPQAVLGLAFSFGIPMAFASVQSAIPMVAWLLFFGNFFWVLAYDTEYAMVDREDDLKIGIKTSAITLGQFDVIAVILFYLLYLAIWTYTGYLLHLGIGYFIAIVFGLLQVLWHYQDIKRRDRKGCFRAFNRNHWLAFTLFIGIILAYL
jgi:4-hydroxybenzoate polyprenyltransferase